METQVTSNVNGLVDEIQRPAGACALNSLHMQSDNKVLPKVKDDISVKFSNGYGDHSPKADDSKKNQLSNLHISHVIKKRTFIDDSSDGVSVSAHHLNKVHQLPSTISADGDKSADSAPIDDVRSMRDGRNPLKRNHAEDMSRDTTLTFNSDDIESKSTRPAASSSKDNVVPSSEISSMHDGTNPLQSNNAVDQSRDTTRTLNCDEIEPKSTVTCDSTAPPERNLTADDKINSNLIHGAPSLAKHVTEFAMPMNASDSTDLMSAKSGTETLNEIISDESSSTEVCVGDPDDGIPETAQDSIYTSAPIKKSTTKIKDTVCSDVEDDSLASTHGIQGDESLDVEMDERREVMKAGQTSAILEKIPVKIKESGSRVCSDAVAVHSSHGNDSVDMDIEDGEEPVEPEKTQGSSADLEKNPVKIEENGSYVCSDTLDGCVSSVHDSHGNQSFDVEMEESREAIEPGETQGAHDFRNDEMNTVYVADRVIKIEDGSKFLLIQDKDNQVYEENMDVLKVHHNCFHHHDYYNFNDNRRTLLVTPHMEEPKELHKITLTLRKPHKKPCCQKHVRQMIGLENNNQYEVIIQLKANPKRKRQEENGDIKTEETKLDGQRYDPCQSVSFCAQCGEVITANRIDEHNKETKCRTHALIPRSTQGCNWKCHTCNKLYATSRCLIAHKKLCSKGINSPAKSESYVRPLTCTICDDVCASPWELRLHRKHFCQKMEQRLDYKCANCQMKFPTDQSLHLHMKRNCATGNKGKTFTCGMCSMSFSRRGKLLWHRQAKCSKLPKSKFICSKCSIDCQTAGRLRYHKLRGCSGKRQESKMPSFECSLCAKSFPNMGEKRVHMLTCKGNSAGRSSQGMEGKTWQCVRCDEFCKNRWALYIHRNHFCQKMSRKLIYKCENCQMRFPTKKNRIQHMKRLCKENKSSGISKVTGVQTWRCLSCDEDCKTSWTLRMHRKHFCQKMACKLVYKCENCEMRFPTGFSRIQHRKKLCKGQEKENKFKCSICSLTFATPGKQKWHEMTQCTEREKKNKWRCSKCSFDFSTLGKLKYHQLNIRRGGNSCPKGPTYQCRFCSKTFPNMGKRRVHFLSCKEIPKNGKEKRSRISSKNKSDHICKVCNEEFDTDRRLVYHVRQFHAANEDDVTIFKCMKCNSTFETHKHLREHQGTCYRCRNCEKDFKTHNQLQYHRVICTGYLAEKRKTSFNCSGCSLTFESYPNLFRHQTISSPKCSKVTNRQNKCYKCSRCAVSFPTYKVLKMHLSSCFQCVFCKEKFHSINRLSYHRNQCSVRSKLLKRPLTLKHICKRCDISLGTSEKLHQHLKTCIKCRDCSKNFSSDLKLKYHRGSCQKRFTNLKQSAVKKEVCEVNEENEGFLRNLNMPNVKKEAQLTGSPVVDRTFSKTTDPLFKCTSCNVLVIGNNEKERHISICKSASKDSFLHVCHLCAREFNKYNTLYEHKRLRCPKAKSRQTPEKANPALIVKKEYLDEVSSSEWSCTECSTSFDTYWQLVHHKRRGCKADDAKYAFVCRKCLFRAKDRKELHFHIRHDCKGAQDISPLDVRYYCGFCSTMFRSEVERIDHKKRFCRSFVDSNNESSKYVCKWCFVKFRDNAQLNDHEINFCKSRHVKNDPDAEDMSSPPRKKSFRTPMITATLAAAAAADSNDDDDDGCGGGDDGDVNNGATFYHAKRINMCIRCRLTFPSFSVLEKHRLRCFTCRNCRHPFQTNRRLRQHREECEVLKDEMRKSSFQCDSCFKSFKKYIHLFKHQTVQSPKCSKTVIVTSNITRHTPNTHVDQKNVASDKRIKMCIKCHRTFPSFKILNKHLMQCYKCRNCQHSFNNYVGLQNHRRNCEVLKEELRRGSFQCDSCSNSFDKYSRLFNHQTVQSPKCFKPVIVTPNITCDNQKNDDEDNGSNCDKRIKMCIKCRRTFSSFNILKKHLTQCYKCRNCQHSFNNYDQLQYHRRNCEVFKEEMRRGSFQCDSCSISFDKYSRLFNHQTVRSPKCYKPVIVTPNITCNNPKNDDENSGSTSNSDKRINMCIKCRRTFLKFTNLKKHTLQCFKCRNCQHNFDTESRLYNHRRVCENRKEELRKSSFQCDSCSKSFVKYVILFNHQTIGSPKCYKNVIVKPDFTCNDPKNDEKNNGSTSNFDKRINMCIKCRRTFVQFSNLKKHMLQCFKCRNCQHTFENYYQLHDHRKVCKVRKEELRKGTFQCESCSSSFKTYVQLFNHQTVQSPKCYINLIVKPDITCNNPKNDDENNDPTSNSHKRINMCIKCRRTFLKFTNLKKHSVQCFKCRNCQHSFKTLNRLRYHREVCEQRKNELNLSSFECKSCSSSFETYLLLFNHQTRRSPKCCETVIGTPKIAFDNGENNGSTSNYDKRIKMCIKCHRTFPSFNLLRRHVPHCHKCRNCQYTFESKGQLARHREFCEVLQDEKRKSSFQCQSCSVSFKTYPILFNHQTIKSPMCYKNLNSGDNPQIRTLKKIKVSEFVSKKAIDNEGVDNPKPEACLIICSKCFKTYPSSTSLNRHIRMCFKCRNCAGNFNSASQLESHRHGCKHVLEEKRNGLRCETCSERFVNYRLLFSHQTIKSPKCGKPLLKKAISTRRQAEVKRPNAFSSFKCSNCNSCFHKIRLLRAHYKRCHSNNALISKCQNCMKTFPSWKKVTIHLKSCNICRNCGQNFPTKRLFHNHRKSCAEFLAEKNNGSLKCTICLSYFPNFWSLFHHATILSPDCVDTLDNLIPSQGAKRPKSALVKFQFRLPTSSVSSRSPQSPCLQKRQADFSNESPISPVSRASPHLQMVRNSPIRQSARLSSQFMESEGSPSPNKLTSPGIMDSSMTSVHSRLQTVRNSSTRLSQSFSGINKSDHQPILCSSASRRRPMETVTTSNLSETDEPPQPKSSSKHVYPTKCIKCLRQFSSRGKLKIHIGRCYACRNCSKSFSSMGRLSHHRQKDCELYKAEKLKTSVECKSCSAQFINPSSLFVHQVCNPNCSKLSENSEGEESVDDIAGINDKNDGSVHVKNEDDEYFENNDDSYENFESNDENGDFYIKDENVECNDENGENFKNNDENNLKWKCEPCGKGFKIRRDLRHHSDSCCSANENQLSTEEQITDREESFCDFEPVSVKTEPESDIDYVPIFPGSDVTIKEETETFTCEFCSIDFMSEEHFTQHLEDCSADILNESRDKTISCDTSFQNGVGQGTSGEVVTTFGIVDVFPVKSEVREPTSVDEVPLPLTLDYLSSNEVEKTDLERRRSRVGRKITCEKCNKQFKTQFGAYGHRSHCNKARQANELSLSLSMARQIPLPFNTLDELSSIVDDLSSIVAEKKSSEERIGLEKPRSKEVEHNFLTLLKTCDRCNQHFKTLAGINRHRRHCKRVKQAKVSRSETKKLASKKCAFSPVVVNEVNSNKLLNNSEAKDKITFKKRKAAAKEFLCAKCLKNFPTFAAACGHKSHCKRASTAQLYKALDVTLPGEPISKEGASLPASMDEFDSNEGLNNSEVKKIAFGCSKCTKHFRRLSGAVTHQLHCKSLPLASIPSEELSTVEPYSDEADDEPITTAKDYIACDSSQQTAERDQTSGNAMDSEPTSGADTDRELKPLDTTDREPTSGDASDTELAPSDATDNEPTAGDDAVEIDSELTIDESSSTLNSNLEKVEYPQVKRRNFPCKGCYRSFRSKQAVNRHQHYCKQTRKRVKSVQQAQFGCCFCDMEFGTKKHLDDHNERYCVENTDIVAEKSEFICKSCCNTGFLDREQLLDHAINFCAHSRKGFQRVNMTLLLCKLCYTKFGGQDHLDDHNARYCMKNTKIIVENSEFECQFCTMRFRNTEQLIDHENNYCVRSVKRLVLPSGEIMLQECNDVISSKDFNLLCLSCSAKFRFQEDLDDHNKSLCLGNKAIVPEYTHFFCKNCCKRFRNQAQLSTHTAFFCFLCKCGRVLQSKSGLKQHTCFGPSKKLPLAPVSSTPSQEAGLVQMATKAPVSSTSRGLPKDPVTPILLNVMDEKIHIPNNDYDVSSSSSGSCDNTRSDTLVIPKLKQSNVSAKTLAPKSANSDDPFKFDLIKNRSLVGIEDRGRANAVQTCFFEMSHHLRDGLLEEYNRVVAVTSPSPNECSIMTCKYCKSKWSMKELYKDHLLSHIDPLPFHCDRCNEKFNNIYLLKHHLQWHLKN